MVSVEEPVAGFYRMRLVRGGPLVGIRIWHGRPKDPLTGEIMDRSWRWQAEANGDPIDLDRVWPACTGDEIASAEYDYLKRRTEHARQHDGFDPTANPRRRTNWNDSTIPSFGD
ncbi:MAG: hypothetical protein V4696_03580 [Pseudomonadota bacterium]